jgi:hypothetical protein
VIAALAGTGVLTSASVLAAATDVIDAKQLGILAPFFLLLVGLLYRESKKRDEAEAMTRALYQAQLDKYEPAARAMQVEMTAVLRDAVAEIAESRADRMRRSP